MATKLSDRRNAAILVVAAVICAAGGMALCYFVFRLVLGQH